MLQVYVYGASTSRGMPVYFPAFAGTHSPTQEGFEPATLRSANEALLLYFYST